MWVLGCGALSGWKDLPGRRWGRGKDGFDLSRRGVTKEERKKRGGVGRERRWGLGE